MLEIALHTSWSLALWVTSQSDLWLKSLWWLMWSSALLCKTTDVEVNISKTRKPCFWSTNFTLTISYVLNLPHLDWMPGRCGFHHWTPGLLRQTLSPRFHLQVTHTQEWHCGTGQWPSQPRGCDCWHSFGLLGQLFVSSVKEWNHWCYH